MKSPAYTPGLPDRPSPAKDPGTLPLYLLALCIFGCFYLVVMQAKTATENQQSASANDGKEMTLAANDSESATEEVTWPESPWNEPGEVPAAYTAAPVETGQQTLAAQLKGGADDSAALAAALPAAAVHALEAPLASAQERPAAIRISGDRMQVMTGADERGNPEFRTFKRGAVSVQNDAETTRELVSNDRVTVGQNGDRVYAR